MDFFSSEGYLCTMVVRSFYSLLPHLLGEGGHYVVYHKAIQAAVKKNGWDFHCLVSKKWQTSALPDQWVKIFPQKYKSPFGKYIGVLSRLFTYAKIFVALKKQEQSRFFFLECFKDLELAIFCIAAVLFLKKNDRILLLYRYDIQNYKFGGVLLKFFTRMLIFRFQHRFIRLTDSDLLAEEFDKYFPKVHVMPIPHGEITLSEIVKKDSKINFWWPGVPNESKGLRDVARMLILNDLGSSRVRLVVASSAALLQPTNQIELLRIPNILPRSEYIYWFSFSDIILLPYNADHYRVSTSGIFVEAVIANRIPFTKEGNWIAHELKKHNLTELIIDWESPDILSHIIELYLSARIREKLDLMRKQYIQFHSTNRFAEIALRLVP